MSRVFRLSILAALVGISGLVGCEDQDEPGTTTMPKDTGAGGSTPTVDAGADTTPTPDALEGSDVADTGGSADTGSNDDGSAGSMALSARIIAVGIPGAGAVAPVGTFHTGGPIHDKPEFLAYTVAGKVLDPARVIVASSSNFGAPIANPSEAAGAILSIEPAGGPISVPANFAQPGGQVSELGGRLQLFTAQSPPFLNKVNTPLAVTAAMTAVNMPLGISINNAFGRLWFADWTGGTGLGTLTIIDPTGAPLAGAPSPLAGGVFAGSLTNRDPQLVPGSLGGGSIGTAFLGKSPDGTAKAVFAALNIDGSVIQAHAAKAVDGLAAGVITAVTPGDGSSATRTPGRAGMAFNWVPDKILYVSDPNANAIVALTLSADTAVFHVASSRRIAVPELDVPVDIAPAVQEVANAEFSSNSSLAGGADLYVANRGNGTVVRLSQAGIVVAVRTIQIDGHPVGPGQLNGIATSPDAQKIWLTISGAVPGYPEAPGALIEVPAFAGATTMASAIDPGPSKLEARGEALFRVDFGPAHGLGPLFNARSCLSCHGQPTAGGQGKAGLGVVSVFGHLDGTGFDPLRDIGGPVARAHAIGELGDGCTLRGGVPARANLISVRNAPDLFAVGLLDGIPDAAILAQAAVLRPDGVKGHPNLLPGAAGPRVGRFGWKANVASLAEFVGVALRNELGLTNPLAARDVGFASGACGVDPARLDDDGQAAMALTAYIASLRPAPQRTSDPHGGELFATLGCATCHLPAFPTSASGTATLPLYSDLLLHDLGADLDDGVMDNMAGRRDWRTTPLWGLGGRSRFLHDGRSTTVDAAIAAHGGEAKIAAQRFAALLPDDRQAVLDFLASL